MLDVEADERGVNTMAVMAMSYQHLKVCPYCGEEFMAKLRTKVSCYEERCEAAHKRYRAAVLKTKARIEAIVDMVEGYTTATNFDDAMNRALREIDKLDKGIVRAMIEKDMDATGK